MAELLRFPLVLIVLHAAAIFALVIWAAMKRLGPARRSPPRIAPGKLGLIENTSQLLCYRGRALDTVLRYFDESVRTVAGHYHITRELSKHELVEHLQSVSDRRGVSVDISTLRTRLSKARQSKKEGVDEALKISKEIYRWRQEMIDGN
jgi:hypothetical protein